MDAQLLHRLNQKIDEISSENIKELASSLDGFDYRSLAFGILVGRLYNSFHYQSRRILDRNPTHDEFLDFVQLVQSKRSKLLELLN